MAGHIANQFRGLPMSDLIGGPLQAASQAQISLADATAQFINEVGFVKGSDQVRMVDFKFKRPRAAADSNDQTVDYGEEEVSLSVPFLSLVNTPALCIKKVDITFDMEVKETTSEKSSSDTSASLDSHIEGKWLFAKASVNIKGSVSSHKENTRTTDNSAKYHVQVFAEDTGMTEGLSRVYDILQGAIAPRKVDLNPQSSNQLPSGSSGQSSPVAQDNATP